MSLFDLQQPRTALKPSQPKVPTTSPWKDPRTTLFYLALVSIALIVLPPLFALIYRTARALKTRLLIYRAHRLDETSPLLNAADADADDDESVVLLAPPRAPSRVLEVGTGSLSGDLKAHVTASGGWLPFTLDLIRLGACLTLVGLTLAAIVIDAHDSAAPEGKTSVGQGLVEVLKKGDKKGKWGGRKKSRKRREAFGREEWVEIGQCFFFVYCSILALVSLTLPRFRLVKLHLSILLLAAFGLSAWRNLVPLVMGKMPLDIVLHHLKGVHDPLWDTLVWVRIALLTLVGLALPAVSALVLHRREAGGGVVLVVDDEQEVQEA